jgi:hypothetical protein
MRYDPFITYLDAEKCEGFVTIALSGGFWRTKIPITICYLKNKEENGEK